MPGLEPEVHDIAVQGASAKLDAMLREASEVFGGAGQSDPETDLPQVESSSRTSDSVPVESISKTLHHQPTAGSGDRWARLLLAAEAMGREYRERAESCPEQATAKLLRQAREDRLQLLPMGMTAVYRGAWK